MRSRFRAFFCGMGHFAALSLPPEDQYYPYCFPEEAMTRLWETVGRDIKQAIRAYQEEEDRHG